ncbi:lipoprotein [Streptomyces sp. SCL15-4]|uniref:lipoprotein n=1 Tax=Streptomyces sp. SCL15-4 TaxID=2967221 RepID=UPI0029667517|nr:lipoprotein [Streptomyces sp. SCL15-4]
MQVRVGTVGGRVAVAAAVAVMLGGCAGTADDGKKSAGASASAKGAAAGETGTKATSAARGGTLGPAGSACELPVGFAIAKGWKPKSVDAEKELAKAADGEDGDLAGQLAAALLRQGPVTAACEIDAKPSGNIGFLRVWKGKPGNADAGGVLRAFLAAEKDVSEAKYHSFTTGGGVAAVEVEYLKTNKLMEETKKESAFAVGTPDGPVVLHLGGMDTQEHDEMRPAYDLAKQTLKLS